jgi:hypothetical protein
MSAPMTTAPTMKMPMHHQNTVMYPWTRPAAWTARFASLSAALLGALKTM